MDDGFDELLARQKARSEHTMKIAVGLLLALFAYILYLLVRAD